MGEFSINNIYWIWLLVAVPIVYLLYSFLYEKQDSFDKGVELFAEKKLLRHLVRNYSSMACVKDKIIVWCTLWVLIVFAMIGPRWGYEEVETYSSDDSLVILLDLSKSMNATDIKPSRIDRAKQEIEDILKLKDQDLKVALIGFSAVPHLIAPLTFDNDTLINLLPHIDTSLVRLEGSDLGLGVKMANSLLKSTNSYSKSILVMSDGGFDGDALGVVDDGIALSFMGFGTKSGGPILGSKGSFLKENGQIIIDKLQSAKMRGEVGNGGSYIGASFLESDSKSLLRMIKKGRESSKKSQNDKLIYYNEIFYIPVILTMLVMVFLFKRGAGLLLLAFFLMNPQISHANIFLNSAQQAKKAYEAKDYDVAVEKFKDDYQKGVVQYRAKKYKEAGESFAKSDNDKSSYNLGNSFFKQNKMDKAIESYEEYLKTNPDDEDAKFNVELAKKILKQQPKNKDKKKKSNDSKDGDKSSDKQNEDSQSKKNDGDKEDDSSSQDGGKKEDKDHDEASDETNDKDVNKKSEGKNEEQKDDSEESKKINTEKQRRDFNADRQLNRIKSNPSNILRNQFYIEEQIFLLNKDKVKK